MKKLDIVYASDDGYAILAGVSILSLLENNQDADSITIHFFDDGISAENREKLTLTVQDYNREIVFYDIRKKLRKLMGSVNGLAIFLPNGGVKETYAAYGRIFIGNLLPNTVERALYLDCDTLIEGSLQPIFANTLEKVVSMVLDCSRPEYKKFIGLSVDDFYFNSGVIVFDLAKWRNENWTDKVLSYISSSSRSYPFADQDFLNHALKGHIAVLSCKYNFMSAFFLYSHAGTKFVYGFDRNNWFYGKDEFVAAQKQSVIYHFCGLAFACPIYRNSCHPVKKKFDRLYFSSRWKDVPQKEFSVVFHNRVRIFLYRFTPRWFAALLGFFAMKRAMRIWR